MTRLSKHNNHALFPILLCMLLAWRVRAFVGTARTFSSVSAATPISTTATATAAATASRGSCTAARSLAQYWQLAADSSSSASSNVNGDTDDDTDKVPQTGWTHNQPSESSDFWKSEASEQPNESSSSNESSAAELRTGWLHNTAPVISENAATGNGNIGKKGEGGSEARHRLELAMKQQERNHRIVSPPTFHECGTGRAIVVTEHVISLPLMRPSKAPRVNVAFTISEKVESQETRQWFTGLSSKSPQQRAADYVKRAALQTADGLVLYLQGGPGFGAPTPVSGLGLGEGSSWAATALDTYSRVVLMDQRGTGKSTPITKQTLERKFPNLFLLDRQDGGGASIDDFAESHPEQVGRVKTAVGQATDYLAQFRADNIVKDAEEIRDALLLPTKSENPRPWGCALGQSFGGFCMMTYLSQVDNPPQVCLLTGGIAPMLTPTQEAYDSLWNKVQERSLRFYEQYPGDVTLVNNIVKKLLEQPATLPSRGTLTARRFLQLGMSLGGSPSAFASMHALFSSAFVDMEDEFGELEFNREFLKQIDSSQPFDDNPIYFWLHESIYANGPQNSPTNWVAQRAYDAKVSTPSEFDYKLTSTLNTEKRPTIFFGEMVFKWMAEDYAELQGLGLSAVADALSSKTDWGPLYDAEHMRKVLSDGTSRAAAAVYHGDMYVDFDACMKVLQRGGPLENCKPYVTNEYQHGGLRDDGAAIFKKLLGMANGSIRTPS